MDTTKYVDWPSVHYANSDVTACLFLLRVVWLGRNVLIPAVRFDPLSTHSGLSRVVGQKQSSEPHHPEPNTELHS
jgi:hypothetical protein